MTKYLIAAGLGFVAAGPIGVILAIIALFCLNMLMSLASRNYTK